MSTTTTILQLLHTSGCEAMAQLKKDTGDYLVALDNIRQYGHGDGRLNEPMAQRLAGELHGRATTLGLSIEEERQLWEEILGTMNVNMSALGSWNATTAVLRGFHPDKFLFSDSAEFHSFPRHYGSELVHGSGD